MGGTSYWIGVTVAALVGVALGAVIAHLLARARQAASETMLTAQRADLESTGAERDALRTALATAHQGEAGARASLSALAAQLSALRVDLEQARARVVEERDARAHAMQDLRALEERSVERERAHVEILRERERSLVELKATVEQSKTTLSDVFKATGADVLKATAESLLRQAKEGR